MLFRSISPAERTIVAIARALDGWRRPEGVLVLDEPTTELHGGEVDKLFDVVRRVAAGGAGVIFISHRLDEVMSLADRVLALRDGRVVGDVSVDECDHDRLIHLIVGRQIEEVQRSGTVAGATVLEARGVAGGTVAGAELTVRAGEIVGLGGLIGSGREAINGLLFGARRRTGGDVRVLDRSLAPGDVTGAIAAGLAYVPADRHVDGAVLQMSAQENLTLPGLRPLRRAFGRLDRRAERTEIRFDRGHGADDIRLLRDIADIGFRFAACVADLLGNAPDAIGTARDHRDPEAFLCESHGDRLSQSVADTGDQHRFIHCASSFRSSVSSWL